MAYQVTGEVLHEWIGMGMTALVIIHQIFNRKWYGAIFKGKHNPSYYIEVYSDNEIGCFDTKIQQILRDFKSSGFVEVYT
jgi:hypothetical protein